MRYARSSFWSSCIAGLWLAVGAPAASASAQSPALAARGADPERPPADPERPRSNSANPFWFPHMPDAGFGLHLGGGVVHFPPAVLEREGIGDPAGFALGFHLLAWRFMFADVGIGWLWATDRRPFLETACDTQGRGCADDESMIDGYMGWIKAGPQARFFVPVGADALELAVLGGFGVKDWNLSREAKHGGATCIDCRSDDLDADGGILLSPEIDIAYAFGTQADSGGFGVKAVYEHYLSGDALRGLWLSAFFEAYVW